MKQHVPWEPSPEQMQHWPEVSGNAINGVGEAEVRRPTPIMWHPPEMIAHGAVQTWFWGQGPKDPEVFAVASRLPYDQKITRSTTKYALRGSA